MAKEIDTTKEETISALSIPESTKVNGGFPPITVGNPTRRRSSDRSVPLKNSRALHRSPRSSAGGRPGASSSPRRETSKPWENRAFYFVLSMEGRDPSSSRPDRETKDRGKTIRPVLLVRWCHHGQRKACGH
jgi:hypothetical protein